MVTINLLPWREYERLYQQKITRYVIGASIILTLLIVFFLYSALARMEHRLRADIKHLKSDINRYTQRPDPKVFSANGSV